MKKDNPLERGFETLLFASRWLMVPFYFGLVISLVVLMASFVHEILTVVPHLLTVTETETIIWILTLIDLSLAANLLIMVIFSGYENFVSKMGVDDHPDKPAWMGTVDFSGMKLKLVASIVAISAIHLLKAFMEIETVNKVDLQWLVIIHLVFVVSGVLLAIMDKISEHPAAEKH
jgi:uncharacterized protein (TIGR00645 family)